MDGNDLNTALIGAAAALIASFLTWLGVRRQSSVSEKTAYLGATNEVQRLLSEISEGFRQDLARAENARRSIEAMQLETDRARIDAERARDQAIAETAELRTRMAAIERRSAEFERRTAEAERRSAEFERRYQAAEQRYQDAEQRTSEYRRGYKKLLKVLGESIGPEGLDELSDLPEV